MTFDKFKAALGAQRRSQIDDVFCHDDVLARTCLIRMPDAFVRAILDRAVDEAGAEA